MENIYTPIKKLFKRAATGQDALPDSSERFIRLVRRAVENSEFEVYYQPQYNYNTKKLFGAEALMRWRQDEKNEVSPAVFVPRLEKCGMIYEVDKLIWKKVCADMRTWLDLGLNVPHLSVNLSGDDIYHEGLEGYFTSLLAEYSLKPKDLHLEITETAYIKDLKLMAEVIDSLKSKGFVVEMDDFGSGYSSLRTLKNVPFDVIKLDMELLQESETNEKAKNILTAVIEMLQKIEIEVIVEGVEREEQAKLLGRLGCNYMQGYYFGRPTDREHFEEILKNNR